MPSDEQAIRDLLTQWMAATKAGDTATVLGLMSDDVVFTVAGQEPFGKTAFAAASQGMSGMQIDGNSEIVELKILGDWAWMRAKLRVVITLPDGKSMARSGYTLTILQKLGDGRWVIARDANLLTPENFATAS